MYRVTGEAGQQLAGKIITFTAMKTALALAAGGNGTGPMVWITVCCNASAAVVWLFKFTAFAAKTAPRINHDCPLRIIVQTVC